MKYLSRTVLCVLVFCCLIHEIKARDGERVPPAGLWCKQVGSNACKEDCQDQLKQSLQKLTGWQSLSFTAEGQLIVAEPAKFVQGSESARQLFQSVWQTGDVYWIEDHSRSQSVNFGQLNEGLSYEDMILGRRCTVWSVRLDFKDFNDCQASRVVRATFDPGFTFMHELLHGLGHEDAHSFEEVGECEEVINRIREELSLPVRAQYFADSFTQARGFVSAKIMFKRQTSEGKERSEWLYFRPGANTLIEDLGSIAADAVSLRNQVKRKRQR
jgi:hypothetical protein